MNRFFIVFCLALVALGAMALPTQAQTPIFWSNTSWGYVDNIANWDLGYVPGTGTTDTVLIDNGGLALADATHHFGPNPFVSLVDDFGIYIGNTASGGLQQSGGTITTNHGLLLGTAAGSYGYYGISGPSTSELNISAAGGLAGVIPMMIGYNGMGVYNQTGGTVKAAPGIWAVGLSGGLGVTCEMSVTGGTLTTTTLGSNPVFIVGWGSNGILNIGGTANVNLEQGNLFLSQGGASGTFNLGDVKSSMGGAGGGGGVLRTNSVFDYDGSGNTTVNFHGGTLQVASSNPPSPYVAGGATYGFFNLQGGKAVVYSEGALIDTNGFNADVNSGLIAPSGQGLSGITLTTHGSGFIGEPVVTLTDTGGSGSGATARAIVDLDPASPTFQQVTKIVVTNPGMNYSGPVSVSFTGGGPGAVLPTIGTTSLADNVSGGLTKTGLGNLSLNAACSYTGPTVVQQGTLTIHDASMNNTIITVKNGATLAGVTLSGSTAACPMTTVESGGSIAPGTPGQIFVMSDVLLETGTNLNFTFSALGDTVDTIYANTVSSVGGGPITVNVNYTNVPASAVTPLMYGVIASNITFTLSGGVPVFDSSDGVTAPATLDASSGSELDLIKGGILADSVPGWNAAGGGSWTENDKWVNDLAPIVHLHPDGGGDRGLFVKNLGGAAIPISLDISPRLSSMIFASPSGESYTITPSASGKTITLDSGIAQNWHITVLGGSHTVAADMKLGAGTGAFAGQSVIRLVDDSHLTLSGVLSNETTAVGVNFVGNFNGGAGTGVLTLNGANTYTGPTIVTSGVLEAATIANVASANSLGKSNVAPANLVLNNGTLRYTGTAAASTDRGFTVQGNSTVHLDANAGFTGQVVGDASSALTVTGPGTLTLGNTSASANSVGTLQIVNGELTVDANSKLQVTTGLLGGNNSTGDLTINGGGVLTSPSANRFEIAHNGNSHIVLSGTSTTSPAILSIGGTAWIGVSLPGESLNAPSAALVELSGTAEMHVGTTGPVVNAHVGLGEGMTGTISMKDDSKFTCEITPRSDDGAGWLDMGDLGGTANVILSDRASFTVTNSHAAIGSSTGGKGHITLNDSATFTAARYVYVGVADAAEASITLNGGTFTAPYFFTAGPGVINFNGGALKASAASNGYIQGDTFAVNVQAGGAKIDTNGFNVTVAHTLQHDPAAGAPAIDGGLTKLGAGTLTLNAPNTYTGPTVVKDGTLLVKKDTIVQAISTAPNATGNRGDAGDGPYSLGRIFEVNPSKTIQVTQLGVFDDAGDGLAGTHTVYLTDVTTPGSETNLTSVTFDPGTSAAYQNGFRVIPLATALTLNPGRYQIWVDSIGGGVDKFGQAISSLNVGSGAITLDGPFEGGLTSYYSLTPGTRPDQLWGQIDADASFVYYDPGSLITPSILLSTTPVLLGGAAGSTPKLDVQGASQQIASLADVAGAVVKGVVTNSDLATPVVLTLGATTGTTTYSGSIEGNLSLVKSGGSTQILAGPLTYSGNTDIQAGTLEIATPGAVTLTTVTGSDSGALTVCDGTTLTATSIQIGTLTIGGTPHAAAVPEPGTLALLALAVLGGIGMAWRKRR